MGWGGSGLIVRVVMVMSLGVSCQAESTDRIYIYYPSKIPHQTIGRKRHNKNTHKTKTNNEQKGDNDKSNASHDDNRYI